MISSDFPLALGLMIIIIEFNNAGCLLISEVKYLLENRDKDPPDTASALHGPSAHDDSS